MLVGDGQYLAVELLNDEANEKIGSRVFLWQHQKDGGLFSAELFRVDGGVEAQHLLQLGVEEGVQAGQHGGQHRRHRLIARVERRARKPLCLMLGGQLAHVDMRVVTLVVKCRVPVQLAVWNLERFRDLTAMFFHERPPWSEAPAGFPAGAPQCRCGAGFPRSL